MHALVTYLVKGSAYVLANEFVAFITFYVRKINVCLKKSYYSSLFSHLNTSEWGENFNNKVFLFLFISCDLCSYILRRPTHDEISPLIRFRQNFVAYSSFMKFTTFREMSVRRKNGKLKNVYSENKEHFKKMLL